jgi:hypothetical protein
MTTQEIKARSRRTDPKTSHEAGAKVSNTESIRNAIIDILRTGAKSDREIYKQYVAMQRLMGYPRLREGEGDIRKRRAELVSRARVTYAGFDSYQKNTKTYQRAWRLTDAV